MDNSQIDSRLTAWAAMLGATLMIAHHVAGKATRDALFLTQFEVTSLPKMMIVAALLSVTAVLGISRFMSRLGPARLVPRIYATSGLGFLLEWVLMGFHPELIAVILYLHITVLGAIVISGFWSVINERFDPYTAKSTIARLAGFATLGGLLGGLGAKVVADMADTRAILLMLGAIHLTCALALAYVARGHQQAAPKAQEAKFLFSPLKTNPLIRNMAVLVVLVATTAALLDYLLKSTASATLPKEELIHFFSYFYMAVGLGGFLLQTLVGDKALRRLGLGGAMAAWPLMILAGGVFAFVIKHLLSITLLRAGANLFYNSFFRAGFEVLYTPIAAADKRSTKTLIDVGADRSGDMLGSLLVMGILLIPAATDEILIVTAMALAGLCLLLILLLHKGYVGQLADNLRTGSLRPEEIEVVDATTRNTVAATQTALERDKLLAQIARSRKNVQPTTATVAKGLPATDSHDPVVNAIADLRSGEAERIKRVLATQAITPTLLPHLIPLLTSQEHLRDVFQAMRPLASTATGQLIDALLDRKLHPLIRRRLPLVLGQADSQRAVQGLMAGLTDEDWNVRFRCGQACQRLKENYSDLTFDRANLMELVDREIRFLQEPQASPSSSPAERSEQEGSEHLHHLFNLLGLIYDPRVFELCFRAVHGSDRGLQGTALEYMENLVPQELRRALWPLISRGETLPKSGRSSQEMVRELLSAAGRLKGKGGKTKLDQTLGTKGFVSSASQ